MSGEGAEAHRMQARPTTLPTTLMAKRTGIGSHTAEDLEGGRHATPHDDNDNVKKGRKSADPDRIQKNLDRYREEMVEDAPASNSPEDNP